MREHVEKNYISLFPENIPFFRKKAIIHRIFPSTLPNP
jgi:hypothetical protein